MHGLQQLARGGMGNEIRADSRAVRPENKLESERGLEAVKSMCKWIAAVAAISAAGINQRWVLIERQIRRSY